MLGPERKRDKKFRTKYIAGKTQSSNEQQTNAKTYTRSYKVEDSDQSFEACIASTEKGSVYGNTTFTGSNFTSKHPREDSHTANEKNVCLDGSFSKYLKDSNGRLGRIGVGLGDANGHGTSEAENKALATIAFLGSQMMVNRLMEYEDPDSLTKDTLDNIIKETAKELNKRAQELHSASTTVVAACTYPTAAGNRVIGVGIGDSMLAVWEPKKQAFRTLIPSVKLEGGTAIFPTTYKPIEISYCDEVLEEGAILIPMSDGISDYLPLIDVEEIIDGTERVTSRLNPEAMKELLIKPPSAKSQDECIRRITEAALKKSDEKLTERIILSEKLINVKDELIKKGDELTAKLAGLQKEFDYKVENKLFLTQEERLVAEKNKKAVQDEITKVRDEVDNLVGLQIQFKHGDDLHIGGFQVPIKTVEIFRPFIDGKMVISIKNIASQINDYISLFPEAERKLKFSEIMKQKDEILGYLKETKDVDSVKIDRLDKILTYLKKDPIYGKRTKLYRRPRTPIDPINSLNQVIVNSEKATDLSIFDIKKGKLKGLFNKQFQKLDDEMTRQIELLGIGYVEKIEQLWTGKITKEFVEGVDKLFDEMNKNLADNPRWKDSWSTLPGIERIKENIFNAYRVKLISSITEPKKKMSGSPYINLLDALPRINNAYERKGTSSLFEQVKKEYEPQVAIFRPYIVEGKIITSIENVAAEINTYLSNFPKSKRKYKFAELMNKKDEILNYIMQTEEFDLVKVDRLNKILTYLKENEATFSSSNLFIPSIKKPMDSFMEINNALKNKEIKNEEILISSLGEGDLRRLFSDTIRRENNDTIFHDKIAKQIEPLVMEYVEKIEQLWKGKISEQFVDGVVKVFDEMNKSLTSDPNWQKYWNELSPKPDDIELIKERVLNGYRFKIISFIGTSMKKIKDPDKMESKKALVDLLQTTNNSYFKNKVQNKEAPDLEQIKSEYKNKSGLQYVTPVNSVLKEAFKMKAEGYDIKKIKKYIEKESHPRMATAMAGDRYAKYFTAEAAQELIAELFSLDNLISKLNQYDEKCEEVGYDINKKIDLLGSLTGSVFFKDFPQIEADKVRNFLELLNSKVYYNQKGDMHNMHNEDIFKEPSNEEIKTLEREVNEVLNKKMIAAVNNSDMNQIKIYSQLGIKRSQIDENDLKINKKALNNHMFNAIKRGDLEGVKALIEWGANPKSTTADYERPGLTAALDQITRRKGGEGKPPPRTAREIATLMGYGKINKILKAKEKERIVVSSFVKENIDKIERILKEPMPDSEVNGNIHLADAALVKVLDYLIGNQTKVTKNDIAFANYVKRVLDKAHEFTGELLFESAENLLQELSANSEPKKVDAPVSHAPATVTPNVPKKVDTSHTHEPVIPSFQTIRTNAKVKILTFAENNIKEIENMLKASKDRMEKLESNSSLTPEDRDRIKKSITTGDEALRKVLNYLKENQSKVTENDKKFAKFVQNVLYDANEKPNLPPPNTVNLLLKLSTISKAKRKERPG